MKILTNIYHVVFFEGDKSIYVFFKGCNFTCKGCILKISPWDCHLPASLQSKLRGYSTSKTLSEVELSTIVENFKVKKAVLGGGEPTIDEKLVDIIKLLNDHDVYTILLTNGHNLDANMVQCLEKVGLNEVCVSIKAITDSIHTYYTGKSNQRLLKNFKLLNNCRIRLRAESILIPNLIDVDEIERIAKFIASLNPTIPYRIDAYIQVSGTPWPTASLKKIQKAVEVAQEYLENVSYLYADVPIVGEVKLVYPKI